MDIAYRDYFKKPLTRGEIEMLLQGRQASEMFNFRSPSFKALGLAKDTLSDQDLIDLMLKEPRLIHRPVIKVGDQVYFGASVGILEKILTE
jgi:arsenate reductase